MQSLSPNIKAVFFVLAGFLAFNIADAFLNHLVEKYTLGMAGLLPVAFYLIFLTLFSPKLGGLKPIITTKRKPLLLLRSCFGTTCFFCFIYGIINLSLALTYTLILTSALWVSLYTTIFYKEKIGLHRLTAITIGFIGVLIVLRPDNNGISLASFFVLIGAMGYAGLVIVSKKLGESEPLINLVFYPIVTDILMLIIVVSLFEEWVVPDISDFPIFIIGGLFYLLGTIGTSKGYMTGDSSLLAPLHYSQIIWGALIGFFFFAEIPTLWTMIGASLIVSSGIYMIYREHKTDHEAL